MKKIYLHVAGWFFIILGIVGLFLPVLQGILFLFIGAIILAPEVPFFRKLIDTLTKRYPGGLEQATRIYHRICERFRIKR